MFHLLAYTKAIPDNTPTRLDVVSDSVFSVGDISGTFAMPRPLNIVAAAAISPKILKATIWTPTTDKVSRTNVVPLVGAASPSTDPNIMSLLDGPVPVQESDVLFFEAVLSLGEQATGLVWVADTVEPVAARASFWLGYTSLTSSSAYAWKTLTVQWDRTLPPGEYAVIGMQHSSATAIAARLLFESQRYRPGAIGCAIGAGVNSGRTADVFLGGALGTWGTFSASSLPGIEVLCKEATDASHYGAIRVVRLR